VGKGMTQAQRMEKARAYAMANYINGDGIPIAVNAVAYETPDGPVRITIQAFKDTEVDIWQLSEDFDFEMEERRVAAEKAKANKKKK
jgi:hypothetical protein